MTTPIVASFPEAGSALPVHAVSGESAGGPALPVYVVNDRPTLGQRARRVKVITDSDLRINGGQYWLEGRPFAIPVVADTSGNDEGNVPIPVYVVHGSLNPVPVVPVNFFNQAYTGNRNDADLYVGFEFTPVGALTITRLGRSVSVAIAQSHIVGIWTAAGAPLASVTITPLSPVDALGYAYEILGSPLSLSAATMYRIGTQEFNGGDLWMDQVAIGNIPNHKAVAAVGASIYGVAYPDTQSFLGPDSGYGVPTFFY